MKYLQSGMNFRKRMLLMKTQLRLAESDLSTQKQQKAYMEDSGCADIENANCRFLKKAKEDASKIENTEKCISTIKEAMKEAETAFSEFEQKKRGGAAEHRIFKRKGDVHQRTDCRTGSISGKETED